MSRPSENQGFTMSGGSIHAGAMAIGPKATATYVAAGPAVDDARAQMQRLASLLTAHAGELPEETLAIGELAQRELEADQPNKPKLLRWLTLIASGAGSVAAISEAVDTVRQAIEALT